MSCLHQVSFHPLKFVFYSSMFQPECCLNLFNLIRFLSRSNRSAFIVYLIPWAFDSCHSRRSPLLLKCSRFFASSLEFLFHLIPFPFRLGPKISGRDLLLVEECCNAPDPMRQVSASYSPLLPCHLLACFILPCHHVPFILHTCSSHASEHFPRCPFCNPALPPPPVHPSCFLSWAGVKHSRNGPRLVKWPWYTTGQVSFHLEVVWYSNG